MDKKQQQQQKNMILVAAVMVGSGLVFVTVIGFTLWLVFSGGKAQVRSGVEGYGLFDDFIGYSRLYIFPKNLPASAENVEYYYSCQDTFLDPTCQVYLKCNYDAVDYRAEEKRLSHIEESDGERVNSIRYDEHLFRFPAYVAVYDFNYTYEYVLLSQEEREVVYVFTQFVDPEDVVFDARYLPDEFMPRNENPMAGYSLYAFPLEDGAGYYTTY